MSSTFSSLHNRNYRLYAAGGLVSNTGTWMQRVAQDWLVLQLSGGSGTALGITTGLQFLPMLLFSLWGGVLADRYPKRQVLYVTQSAIALTALVMGVLDLTGVVTVGQVYVLAFALGLASAMDNPARQSFVVEMVGEKDLTNAVGLNSASFNAARIIGPALAGLLINLVGTGWVFLGNSVSVIPVLIALYLMDAARLRPAPLQAKGAGQISAGLAYLRGRPDLLVVLGIMGMVGTFGLNFQMTTALMATQIFDKGAAQYGLLGSAMAVGSLAGALVAARRGRPTMRLIVGSATAFGVAEVAAGLMPNYWTFMAVLPLVGVSALTLITAANATMQLSVAPQMRGRVMAVYMAVFMGGTPLGAPFVGWLGEVAGARWSLLSGGLISLASTAVAVFWLWRRRSLRLAMPVDVHPEPAGSVGRELAAAS